VAADVDWATAKGRLQDAYGQDISASIPAGTTISPRSFADITVDGKPALSVRFSLSNAGVTYNCDLTLFQNGKTYQAVMMMAKQPKGSATKIDDFLKTVKLKG